MSFTLAIAGGSSSGKTLLAQTLLEHFQGRACLFPFDSYNKDQSSLSLEEREKIDYDRPSAYDIDLFLRDLGRLKKGEDIALPLFDYPSHTRKNETLLLKSAPLVIVEGFLVLSLGHNEIYDYTVFVSAPAKERLSRRLQRDQQERGYPKEQIIRQFYEQEEPSYEELIAKEEKEADFVFLNPGEEGLKKEEFERLLAQLPSFG
jgi:uridine kinase